MRHPVVIDIETKYTFRDFSDPKKLEVSVIGVYNYEDDTLASYEEKEMPEVMKIVENASVVIGYNIVGFDLPVMQAYYYGDITQFKTFDLLEDIRLKLGHRLGLNDLVKATLDQHKSGHGLKAVELFKEGKIEELKSYCLDDVRLTRELFEYGIKNGEVYYMSVQGKTPIHVQWSHNKTQEQKKTDILLTLPF